MAIAAVVFVAVSVGILAAYALFVVGPEAQAQAALRRRLKAASPAPAARAVVLKSADPLSSIGPLDALLARWTRVSRPLKRLVDQAGVSLTVGSFLLASTTAALIAFMAVEMVTHRLWMGALAGAIGLLVPYAVVRQKRTRRVQQFEQQFPEAVELIARALRAGHAFSTGVKLAADELPQPAGAEFRMLYDKQNYGASLPDSLKAFAERIPSLDARFFVTAVLTQREAGGNLSEVLDRLATVMRERFRVKREMRVMSAHGRITAFVLAGMPPALAGITFAVDPARFKVLITDPLGVRMVAVAVGLQILGTLIVRKLVDLDY